MSQLYSVKRNGAHFVAQVAEHKGKRFLDLRNWIEKDGELVATRKGVTLPLACAADLAQALAQLPPPEAADVTVP
jgi:hypothetical protein